AFGGNDLPGGTCIGIDANKDGVYAGADELFCGTEVISIGDKSYVVESAAEDGSSITFVESALRIPTLDAAMPPIVLETVAGAKIDLSQKCGKYRLIDIWATWCVPCIKALPTVKELASRYDVELISISMDEASAVAKAKEIAAKHGI